MQIDFTRSRPEGSRLIAHVADKGKLPPGLERVLAEGAGAARFEGRAGQIFDGFVERAGTVTRIAIAGAGEPGSERRTANLERAGAALAARFQTGGETVLALDAGDLTAQELASVLLGLRLRNWRWDSHRTTMKDEHKVHLARATIYGAPDGAEAAWREVEALAEGIELTRELVSEPPNVLYPATFVARVRERFAGTGVEITVLGEAELEALGMGALLGVGQGSARDTYLLALVWNGGTPAEAPTAFVGKGVTFDTGGISIKPGPGMEDMKWDMGGAGAVAGGMLALAKRRARANVVGVMGLVENMPDGAAIRPGDILTSMSGQTIEVLNTDAEGRLVLADAITWVQREHKPARIVDFATLTGAMIVALGHEYGGLFANDDTLADQLLTASRDTGDALWRFPLSPAYDKLIDSPIADMKNIGSKGAGSITAAQFIQRFVESGTPWAHCDIAGMVWAEKPGRTWGKGATGYGVRLMDQLIRDTVEK
ncbi:leucyl aminopeptidase [Qipengyuania sediminis]|uniref:leucyl aminopeptidase n=1 Tax=Qipengyuania sediminis TaxID=1532023 RepID=UPI0010599662|nr:leucyl aminopeptidase [Qipengyuania sediminis]